VQDSPRGLLRLRGGSLAPVCGSAGSEQPHSHAQPGVLLLPRACVAPRAQVKETSSRMLTNFSVQASTNDFYTAQRVFKDSGCKALPQVCAWPRHRGACVLE
jgi:hypothetical protein